MIVCSSSQGRSDALSLDESLRMNDVSRAWLVWSGAAEAALADSYRFALGPVPARVLVGRGAARFRVVRLLILAGGLTIPSLMLCATCLEFAVGGFMSFWMCIGFSCHFQCCC